MRQIGEDELQRLDDIDLLRHIVRLQFLIWVTPYRELPFPMKLGILQTAALFGMLGLIDPVFDRPALTIPALWFGAYAIAFSVAAILPQRRIHIRWVK